MITFKSFLKEEVFNWYIVKGTSSKGKVSHVGTERQLKLKIRKPIFPSGHILMKSRKDLKIGDKWKGSYQPEGFVIGEEYKAYPGKGWLDPGERPKIKPKDIVWRSQVHHWDTEVRSDNTRMIVVDTGKSGKERFQMYAISDKSGEVIFHWGGKPTMDDVHKFREIRKWRESKK